MQPILASAARPAFTPLIDPGVPDFSIHLQTERAQITQPADAGKSSLGPAPLSLPPAMVAAMESVLGPQAMSATVRALALESWDDLGTVEPRLSPAAAASIRDGGAVGNSFIENGTAFALVSRQGAREFADLYGLGERDSFEYIALQEVAHARIFKTWKIPLAENEIVAEAVSAIHDPETVALFNVVGMAVTPDIAGYRERHDLLKGSVAAALTMLGLDGGAARGAVDAFIGGIYDFARRHDGARNWRDIYEAYTDDFAAKQGAPGSGGSLRGEIAKRMRDDLLEASRAILADAQPRSDLFGSDPVAHGLTPLPVARLPAPARLIA